MPDEEVLKAFMATRSQPIRVTDFNGKVRSFLLTGYVTAGYGLTATEQLRGRKVLKHARPRGYEVSAFSYVSPHKAFSKLLKKLQISLATRNLDPNEFPHLLGHRCTGRTEVDGVVIDGEFVSWVNLAKIFQSFEGWRFDLKFKGD